MFESVSEADLQNKEDRERERDRVENKMQGVVTTAMVVVLFLSVGLNTLIKASMSKGMSNFVFVAYSDLLAFCFLLLATTIHHRNRTPTPITNSIIFRTFVISILSVSVQSLCYVGLRYSSPTLSSTMEDLVPAYTFIIAIISRMEKVDLKLRSCQAKTIGTVVSIAGALIVTLYKGFPITSGVMPNNVFLSSQQSNWLLGGILLAAGSFCGSVSLVMQAIFVMSTRSVVYACACRKKGAIYVAMFSPLEIVIALSMGIVFLGEALYLGSMIGAGIIAVGFYSVIWGQAQEENMACEKYGSISSINISSSSSEVPLLVNQSKDKSCIV